jgi:hypothetical protein
LAIEIGTGDQKQKNLKRKDQKKQAGTNQEAKNKRKDQKKLGTN